MLNKTQRELPKLPCERPVPEKRRNKSQPELMINPTILKTFRKKETKDDWKIPPSVPPVGLCYSNYSTDNFGYEMMTKSLLFYYCSASTRKLVNFSLTK